MVRLVIFEKLPKEQQAEIKKAIPLGIVEVHCPWWPTDHWEVKSHGEPIPEAYYRIVKW